MMVVSPTSLQTAISSATAGREGSMSIGADTPSAKKAVAAAAVEEDAADYSAIEKDDQLDLGLFVTKKPVWNDDIGAWTLNFNGTIVCR
jgi:hypothetical protein